MVSVDCCRVHAVWIEAIKQRGSKTWNGEGVQRRKKMERRWKRREAESGARIPYGLARSNECIGLNGRPCIQTADVQ